MADRPGTTTYGLLALLSLRPWSSYELTKQARRSLRYVWPSSEAHLYREQQRLVRLGWAEVREEATGARRRRTYRITRGGRRELQTWLTERPPPPVLEMETLLRVFFGDQGTPADLVRSLETTAADSRAIIAELAAFAGGYLEDGGPFPARLHLIALTMELITSTLATIEHLCIAAAAEVGRWPATRDLGMTAETRERFERVVALAAQLHR